MRNAAPLWRQGNSSSGYCCLAKRKALQTLACVLACCLSLSATAVDRVGVDGFYAHTKMFGHSETAPVAQIVLDDFEGPSFDGGEHSFTHNVWRVGWRGGGLHLAAIARYDYVTEYSTDTATLIYADKNDRPIETNRGYTIALDVTHIRAAGVQLGYAWHIEPALTVGFDLAMLSLSAFTHGDLAGQVQVFDDAYEGRLDLDYAYSTDRLLDRVVDRPRGEGVALNVHWHWQPNEQLSLWGQWIDVANRFRIDRAPFTSATADSARIALEDDGRIDVKPVLSGREGFRKETITLDSRLHLAWRYRVGESTRLGLNWDRFGTARYLALAADFAIDRFDAQLQLAYTKRTGAVQLGWRWLNAHVAVVSDDWQWRDARTLGVEAAYVLSF